MKKNNKGFTLAELLIVVAIIAVLVAIAIPVFTTQLEKSRESTDAANIRSAYAEIVVAVIDGTTPTMPTITMQQKQAGWQNDAVEDALDELNTGTPTNTGDLEVELTGTPGASPTCTFAYTAGTATASPKLTIALA